jgi:hypothetical protein
MRFKGKSQIALQGFDLFLENATSDDCVHSCSMIRRQ